MPNDWNKLVPYIYSYGLLLKLEETCLSGKNSHSRPDWKDGIESKNIDLTRKTHINNINL